MNDSKISSEQAKMKLNHCEKEIKEITKNLKRLEKDHNAAINEERNAKIALDILQNELNASLEGSDDISALRSEEEELQNIIYDLQKKYDAISSQHSSLNFQYNDPVPNFDRSKVKGLVAELISVKPEHQQASTALEICAGGKMYNVLILLTARLSLKRRQ